MSFFNPRKKEIEVMSEPELKAVIRCYEQYRTQPIIERFLSVALEGAPTRGKYNLARRVLSDRATPSYQSSQ